MELIEAIKTRKSIRAFLPRPVPRPVLAEILELAAHSPSWSNTQPWEVAVIGGETMNEVKAALVEAATSGASPASDIPQVSFAEPYTSRSRELGLRLYQALGINREDREKRQEWTLQGQRFFDAPNALVFYLDEALGPWSLFDLGLFSQSVMLAALTFDLGTCSMAAVVRHPRVLRRILGIPDNKKIVLGMAIGYPDWQQPANKLVSPRETIESFTKWHGL